ncbi:MAG: RimK family alpha-L-glutamate ligase [Deltaproteobacteria bacterium]|nr:RimK family alpha-L-glutamate ligase [Deltaproteobacteria bacterium]
MNIGIITVRGSDYHPNRRLREAATDRGHKIILVHPYRIWPSLVKNEPSVVGQQPGIEFLDVVLPRQGATVGNSCLALIRHFSLMGIPVVNDLDSILLTKNQFHTLQTMAAARIPVPDTLFVNSPEGLQEAIARLKGYPVVVKQVSGRQGEGVILVETKHNLESVTYEYLDRRKGLLVQRFIPPVRRQDIRVLVVGGKVVGAMELRPKEGDFRANYHLSKESSPRDLSQELEEITLKAVAAVGLEIAGVDLIVDKNGRANVIEVNYSPGFKGMEAATGLDIAAKIVEYVVSTYEKT